MTFTYSIRTFRRVAKYDKYEIKRGIDDFELGNNVQIFASGTPASRRPPSGFAVAVDTEYRSHMQTVGSADLKSHIDRAVGAEFGWGSGVPTAGRVERSDSFVGSKMVRSSVAQSGQVVRRASDRALVMEDDEDDDDEIVTNSHDGGTQVPGHRRDVSEDDQRALLGGLDHDLMAPGDETRRRNGT